MVFLFFGSILTGNDDFVCLRQTAPSALFHTGSFRWQGRVLLAAQRDLPQVAQDLLKDIEIGIALGKRKPDLSHTDP